PGVDALDVGDLREAASRLALRFQQQPRNGPGSRRRGTLRRGAEQLPPVAVRPEWPLAVRPCLLAGVVVEQDGVRLLEHPDQFAFLLLGTVALRALGPQQEQQRLPLWHELLGNSEPLQLFLGGRLLWLSGRQRRREQQDRRQVSHGVPSFVRQ